MMEHGGRDGDGNVGACCDEVEVGSGGSPVHGPISQAELGASSNYMDARQVDKVTVL